MARGWGGSPKAGVRGQGLTFVHVGQGRPATWAMGGEGFSEEGMLSRGQKEPGLGLRWVEATRGS